MYNPDQDMNGLPDPRLDPQFYGGVPFKRLLAWVLDVILITGVTIGVGFFSFGLFFFVFPAVWLLVNFVYRVLTIATGSATWGMRFAGIELRNQQGERFDTGEAFLHTVLYYLMNLMMPVQIVSAAMMLLGARGQGLHDYIMGTTAINRPQD